jgi:hypothetical protein
MSETVDQEPTFEFTYANGEVKLLSRFTKAPDGMMEMPLAHHGEAEKIARSIQEKYPLVRRGYGRIFDVGELEIRVDFYQDNDEPDEPTNILPLRP